VVFRISLTTDSGAASAPIPFRCLAERGREHFEHHQEESASGFTLAGFGLDTIPSTTCASSGRTDTQLTWCQNICEKG